jgi:hypothetical protein
MTRSNDIIGIFRQNVHFWNFLIVWEPESNCWHFVSLLVKRLVIYEAKL